MTTDIVLIVDTFCTLMPGDRSSSRNESKRFKNITIVFVCDCKKRYFFERNFIFQFQSNWII